MDEIIEHKAHARVGLLGNPSDVYYGRTISFSLGNFWATVKLEPSDHLIIKPHPVHDPRPISISSSPGNFLQSRSSRMGCPSSLNGSMLLGYGENYHADLVMLLSLSQMAGLVNRLQNEGYYGGVRLLMAICKVFHSYCKDNNIDLHDRNFTLSYDTNIPRQTGLSGSSAIVCAALSCLLDFYKVRHLVKVEIRPNLVLSAEKELGIVAGLQGSSGTSLWWPCLHGV
ncbi:hypothetical protein Patl1_02854 [Pistacia atlantica]|uniref:Uncharacterized protein n=1 Tax=Pistacia atlantica TaxID=434234 RepID=A0ACC1CCY7_9ROSI|nr:hypothetical protein Patl1_02854 [Pistacia atlantica]